MTDQQVREFSNNLAARKLCPDNLNGGPAQEEIDLLKYLTAPPSSTDLPYVMPPEYVFAMEQLSKFYSFEKEHHIWPHEPWLADMTGAINLQTCTIHKSYGCPEMDEGYIVTAVSQYLGLTNSPYRRIDKSTAESITMMILTYDLAYGDLRLPVDIATSVTRTFFP